MRRALIGERTVEGSLHVVLGVHGESRQPYLRTVGGAGGLPDIAPLPLGRGGAIAHMDGLGTAVGVRYADVCRGGGLSHVIDAHTRHYGDERQRGKRFHHHGVEVDRQGHGHVVCRLLLEFTERY